LLRRHFSRAQRSNRSTLRSTNTVVNHILGRHADMVAPRGESPGPSTHKVNLFPHTCGGGPRGGCSSTAAAVSVRGCWSYPVVRIPRSGGQNRTSRWIVRHGEPVFSPRRYRLR